MMALKLVRLPSPPAFTAWCNAAHCKSTLQMPHLNRTGIRCKAANKFRCVWDSEHAKIHHHRTCLIGSKGKSTLAAAAAKFLTGLDC